MRQLEADQLAEESRLSGSEKATTNGDHPNGNSNGNGSGNSNGNGNGNTTSAPTTPPGQEDSNGATTNAKEAVAPIGQGREVANGAKSMPASRRASGYGTFGMEKLSLSVMDEGTGRNKWEEEEVDDQGAHSESCCAGSVNSSKTHHG